MFLGRRPGDQVALARLDGQLGPGDQRLERFQQHAGGLGPQAIDLEPQLLARRVRAFQFGKDRTDRLVRFGRAPRDQLRAGRVERKFGFRDDLFQRSQQPVAGARGDFVGLNAGVFFGRMAGLDLLQNVLDHVLIRRRDVYVELIGLFVHHQLRTGNQRADHFLNDRRVGRLDRIDLQDRRG